MGFNNIEKKNFLYTFLKRFIIIPTHNKIFYRHVFVKNKDRIPKNSPVIFTPNHQNALMDALAMLCNTDRQVAFLARSDIFSQKWVARILYFFKILPIFRLRDGYGSVKKNQAIFQKTVDIIHAGNGLVILPEGTHEGFRRLRPLKKGFARIAFQTEEANQFSLDLKIVPVGLHYSNYSNSQSDLYVNFGEPISLGDYTEIYRANPAKAINQLTLELTQRLKPLIIEIESRQDYQLYLTASTGFQKMTAREMGHSSAKGFNGLAASQNIIEKLRQIEETKPLDFEIMRNQFRELTSILQDKGILTESFLNGQTNGFRLFAQMWALMAGFPLFLVGVCFHFIPWIIINRFVKKVKDPQFVSSFKYVLSLIVVSVFYFFLTTASFTIHENWLGWWLFALSLPLLGFFVLKYKLWFHNFRTSLKLHLFKRYNRTAYKKAYDIKLELENRLAIELNQTF